MGGRHGLHESGGCSRRRRRVSRPAEETLTAKGIQHEWTVTEGYAHWWTLWRVYLRDLLPKLFV